MTVQDLDFLYTPSKDPAADRDYFVNVLGGPGGIATVGPTSR